VAQEIQEGRVYLKARMDLPALGFLASLKAQLDLLDLHRLVHLALQQPQRPQRLQQLQQPQEVQGDLVAQEDREAPER